MILAAGLTPAWQQILVFDHLVHGDVNRARQACWCPSGKVLNVGVALRFLGVPARMLSAGGGWTQSAMDAELTALDVPHRWTKTAHTSRVCTTVIDSGAHVTTEMVENTGEFTAEELTAYQRAYLEESAGAEVVVLSGSLPHGTPSTYYCDLVSRTPGRVILDVRGPELLEALPAQPFLVKPNRAELARTLKTGLEADADLQRAMFDLNSQGARWVVITDGPRSVWVSSAGQLWKFQPPPIAVVNPIGSGDSLAAGLAAALDRGDDVLAAVTFGMACAADNATQLLPCRLNLSRVQALQGQIESSAQ